MAMNIDKIPERPSVKQFRLLMEKQGRIHGKAEGKQEALLAVLDARGLTVTARQRARILACSDFDVLGGWITRAVSVASTRELLGGEEAGGARRTRQPASPKRATTRRAAAKP